MARTKEQDEFDIEFANDIDIPEGDLSEAQKKIRDLQSLNTMLAAELYQAQSDRKVEIDRRLINAARSYKGAQDASGRDSIEEQFDTPKVTNRIYHNITRQITNDGASQLGDLLFPSDDKNYGCKPIPLAAPPLTLANEPAVDSKGKPLVDQDGNPLTNMQAHNRRVERIRQKAKRMFTKIDSALISSRYPTKARRCIRDAAIYGTGILKAPIPNKMSAAWAKKKTGQYGLKPASELAPDVKCISPFDFFPDLSATEVDEWGYTWERTFLLPADLQTAAKEKGFDPDEVAKILHKGVSNSATLEDESREEARDSTANRSLSNGRFILWERHGHLERKQLEAAGVKTEKQDAWCRCVVYFIDGKVLKVVLSPYERDTTIYSIFNWDEDPLSVFGFGIPYLMEDPAHVYNTAWRMAIDNAGASTLPQIVVDKTQIEPADGTSEYSIYGGKVWNRVGGTYSIEKQDRPFELFHIQQDIQQLFTLMDKAQQDAFELTGVTRTDKAAQMTDNAPVTLGATQIQQNNSSVTRRSQARRYDDQITATLVQRFYDFFMQYEPDDDIKGAMEIEARGSTILLSKELQATNLMTFYQMTEGGNMDGVKGLPLLRAIATSMQHPEGQFIETDEEMAKRAEEAAQQEPEVDPMIAIEERKLGVAEAQIELDQGTLQLESQKAQASHELKVQDTEARYELEYAKLDAKQQESMGKSQAEFAKIESKANFDIQKQQFVEQTKRDTVAAKIGADREKDRRSEAKGVSELAIRKQAEDRNDAELQYKMTTGESGI